jgi:predicted esterase
MRDDPEPGVEVRHVFPNSPAEKAKLEPGDRIMKVGPAAAPNPTVAIVGRDQLMQTMASFASGASIKIEVKRKAAKTEVLTVTLANPPEEIIDEIPRPNSHKKALEKPRGVDPKKDPKKEDPKKDDVKKDDKEKEKFETGIIRRKHPVLGNEYWVLVPENYDPNVAHGLIIWLHSSEKQGSDHDEMKFTWRRFCEEHHFIIVAPRSKNKDGWLAGEAEDVLTVVREEISHYTIDKQRVVAHGWGIGGQMAFYLGFAARDVVRGVATVGGVLASPAKDNEPARRLQFFISAGEKDPIFKDVRESAPKLQEKKLPVYFRKLEEQGKEYIDEDPKALDELKRWLDSVDWI